MAAFARKLPDGAWATGDRALAPAVSFNKLRSAEPDSKEASPFEKSLAKLPRVRAALADENGSWTVFVDHLDGTDLYALSTVQGTLHCQNTVFLKARPGRRARLVDGPGSSDEGDICWTTSAEFASAFGQPVYVVHDGLFPTVSTASFAITPWTGGRWGPTCRVDLNFRATYTINKIYCGDKAVCTAADGIAHDVAVAYNRMREAGGAEKDFKFGPTPPPAFAARVAALADSAVDFPTSDVQASDPPMYGGSGHILFPISIDGRWYAAAVGHGGVGWREDDTTLVGVYAVADKSLTPLAGFVFDRWLSGLQSATLGGATAAR